MFIKFTLEINFFFFHEGNRVIKQYFILYIINILIKEKKEKENWCWCWCGKWRMIYITILFEQHFTWKPADKEGVDNYQKKGPKKIFRGSTGADFVRLNEKSLFVAKQIENTFSGTVMNTYYFFLIFFHYCGFWCHGNNG